MSSPACSMVKLSLPVKTPCTCGQLPVSDTLLTLPVYLHFFFLNCADILNLVASKVDLQLFESREMFS